MVQASKKAAEEREEATKQKMREEEGAVEAPAAEPAEPAEPAKEQKAPDRNERHAMPMNPEPDRNERHAMPMEEEKAPEVTPARARCPVSLPVPGAQHSLTLTCSRSPMQRSLHPRASAWGR